jgi:hypothetical protein
MMEGRFSQVAPLVDQLGRFCKGHEGADRGEAAAAVLAELRSVWPEVPQVRLAADPGERPGAEELALGVVRDVGEVAGVLLATGDPEERLAWARANLVADLKRYMTAVSRAD